ncbi:MAG: hypothetical protein ACHP7P_13530 [Terriglobales bacterium]
MTKKDLRAPDMAPPLRFAGVAAFCSSGANSYLAVDILHPSATMRNEDLGMNIEIRDAALKARIEKQLQAIGAVNIEQVLLHLLETQEEQDRWLAENHDAINAKIKRGIEQLDRGEGIPEAQLDAHLARLKTDPE